MNIHISNSSRSKKAKLNIFKVGFQSWTEDNLLVESNHEGIVYYTTRWDALCPYIDISDEMLKQAKWPFVVYGLPPDGNYGLPIRDFYGMADVQTDLFWHDDRKERKFRELEKLFKNFNLIEKVVPGSSISMEYIKSIGGVHFEKCEIGDSEIEGFLDYITKLDVLILQAYDQKNTLVFSDVSIILPHYNQVYGSFCQWNPAFKSRSPGIYACLAACKWTLKNGFRYYNMGPINEYEYKTLFVNHYEPIYSIVLTDLNHPLCLDETSTLNTDFRKRNWNRIYRHTRNSKKVLKAKPLNHSLYLNV